MILPTPPDGHPGVDRRPPKIPPLHPGDRLTRPEFERRYDATPNLKRAELIDGTVHLPDRSTATFGVSRADLIGLLGAYATATNHVAGGAHGHLRLDLDSMPQPDAYLRIAESHGGQCRIDADGYVEGAPELVAEVAHTSASYDLHAKLRVYRRNGVREYLVWRTFDRAIDHLVLRDGAYVPLAPGAGGLLRSEVFPGLWLDPVALIAGDMPRAIRALTRGLATKAHADFVARMKRAARPRRKR